MNQVYELVDRRNRDSLEPVHNALSRRHLLRLLAGLGAVPFLPRVNPRPGLGQAMAQSDPEWATGGTAAMTAKDSYPNPFGDIVGPCAIVAATTLGPCTTANDLLREDVSEGWTGLPLRLALRLVDSACQVLPGATVKIWHTNIEGSYSGQTPNNGLCLQQPSYASADFFRGVQTTDAAGIVYFDTCFPGWYPGRAIHIHFQVKVGSVSYRVSQLFFPEDMTTDIFTRQPEYAEFGQPDTTFSNDGVIRAIPNAQREPLLFDVVRLADGAMLASKTVAVIPGGVSSTPTPTAPPNHTPTASPTPTAPPGPCTGDCDGTGSVTVDELITGVNIGLGEAPATACSAIDMDASGTVTVDEILAAVNSALHGCT